MSNAEQELIDEARAVLGADEEILGAGIFALADLVQAQVAGGTLGAVTGATVGDGLFAAAGSVVGSMAATQEAAEEHGASVALLVAVTADTIHILNRDPSGRLAPEFASFPRATTTVEIKNFGASRFLTLTDAAGTRLELHGSVGWLSAQAAGDKVVFGLLADAKA